MYRFNLLNLIVIFTYKETILVHVWILAHLTKGLTYRCCCCRQLFTLFSSFQEPLGQFGPNLAQSMLVLWEVKFVKMKGHTLFQGEIIVTLWKNIDDFQIFSSLEPLGQFQPNLSPNIPWLLGFKFFIWVNVCNNSFAQACVLLETGSQVIVVAHGSLFIFHRVDPCSCCGPPPVHWLLEVSEVPRINRCDVGGVTNHRHAGHARLSGLVPGGKPLWGGALC